ncbi:14925_t:CDS:2, partial [Acaulospora colombiana]
MDEIVPRDNSTMANAEVISTRENLNRREDEDKLISKRMEEAKSLIEKFKQQQKENARQITGLKWSLSTARRLPDD